MVLGVVENATMYGAPLFIRRKVFGAQGDGQNTPHVVLIVPRPARRKGQRLSVDGTPQVRGVSTIPILGLDRRTEPADQLINVVKLYVDQIQETYPAALFSDLPTIGLAKRHAWLMRAYAMGGSKNGSYSLAISRNGALMYAQAVIRDHGFRPIIDEVSKKVSFNREMTTDLVDAFMYLGLYYEIKGNKVLSECMRELGMQSYVTMNGSSVGYDVLY
jgi:hypothetical protein